MTFAEPRLQRSPGGDCIGSFAAMASPWEVHLPGAAPEELLSVTRRVAEEVQRIERKYSRYRDDSVVQALNRADGAAVAVDEETARLLDYAEQLWHASEGRFDITTGALRRAWTFDGSDRVPAPEAVAAALTCVGWKKVEWRGHRLRMPPGMEIDFGGIGKEYAVDRALALAGGSDGRPLLINGGGDIAASAPPAPGRAWQIGIEDGGDAAPRLRLQRGAIATSGDARRYLLKDGVRYSHVLDPRTGWPVPQAPRSVTVLASTCSEAGSHSTLALLHGSGAERYLQDAGVDHWLRR